MREKAIIDATAKAAIPSFLWARNIAVATAKEDDVCPDGKELPMGIGISNEMMISVKGLARSKRGFNTKLQRIASTIKVTKTFL